jgi:DNA (cytosine-5)-methyltransferase 1
MSYTVKDLFCGCGGSSLGAANVKDVEVVWAMNHWKLAVDSHNINHPKTKHDVADISNTHPGRYTRTNILVGSPECTNHSLAKGKKRKNLAQCDLFKQKEIDLSAIRSRATMWDIVSFTEHHRYEHIVVENVVDVRHWVLFSSWLKAMHNLGYKHRCVYLNSMFAHGPELTGFAPQSRDRIYIVFWKKNNPEPDLEIRPSAPCARCGVVEAYQSWKNCRTWGKYKTQYLYRCSKCNEQVMPYYYAALNALDLALPMTRIGDRAGLGMRPLSPNTIARIEYGLRKFGLRPTILDQANQHGTLSARIRSAEGDPLNTQTTRTSSYLFSPFVFTMAYTHSKGDRTKAMTDYLATQTTMMDTGLVAPFLMANRMHSTPRGLDQEMHTVVTSQQEMIVAPFVMANSKTTAPQPLHGVMPAVTTRNNQFSLLAAPFTVNTAYIGTGRAMSRQVTDPLRTVTTYPSEGLCIPPSAILTMRGGRSFDSMTDSLATQVAAGVQNGIIAKTPFLTPHYGGSPQAAPVSDAMYTILSKDKISLVEANGQPAVEDCYFRMLQPEETARAQGFPDTYVILGNKDERQKQIGNANPPSTMELLVKRCIESLERGSKR